MKLKHVVLTPLAIVTVLALMWSCSDSAGPLSPSPTSDFSAQPGLSQGSSMANSKPPGGTTEGNVNANGEEFNCNNVQEVHVRFGDPGFVNDNQVGLYINYHGMPAGKKVIRIWWDFENNPGVWEDIDIGEGDIWRDDDALFDYEATIEHVYDVAKETSYRVRVELICRGQTGNCARVRDVTVAPGAAVAAATSTNHTIFGGYVFATGYRDVYEIVAPPGATLTITIDTVSAATTYDPYYWVGTTNGGGSFWSQDDNFGCTFPPPSWSCPTGSQVLPADPDGKYYLTAQALGSRVGPTGGYVLTITSSVPIAAPTLVSDDI